MHRPGKEVEGITDANYSQYRFRAPIDPERARNQQDNLAKLYQSHGIKVFYVEDQREDRPNAMFLRDLVFMTPEGAIICRPAFQARRGEERAVAATLAHLGVPIIKTINGDGYFEGACAMWIDRETVVIGIGSRSNEAGCRQVEAELRNIGVSHIIRTQIPYGSIHLDGYMSMVDKKKMLVFPWHIAYDCAKSLLDMGITLLEASDIHEVKQGMAMNLVTLAPGKVIMPSGNPVTQGILEDAGIEVASIEINEIMNGWGALHCMTVFLRRDPVYSFDKGTINIIG
jgi:N-dimethylarginine dimethylaminohydrolase